MMRRRHFLGLTGAGFTSLLTSKVSFGKRGAEVQFSSLDFGVASADPLQDSVTLWTRLPETTDAFFEVNLTPDFKPASFIAKGEVKTSKDSDFTVQTRVTGLKANTFYYYRFFDNAGYKSQVGRTKTLPSRLQTSRPMRFAIVTCSDFSLGYFSVYDALMDLDLDFVVHLGDNIYEDFYQRYQLRDDPIGRAETLEDYRNKYKLYLTDDSLRNIRAAFPFVNLWDDHEVFDNYDGAILDPAGRFRQKNGYQAFNEYIPGVERTNRKFRSFSIGEDAEFFVLDERQYRDKDTSMLGSEQLNWFLNGLGASKCTNKFVMNEVMFAPFTLSGVLADTLRRLNSRYSLNTDAWDGYYEERQTITEFLAAQEISGVNFCTGDIHDFYQNTIRRDPVKNRGEVVAQEFVTASITAYGIGDTLGLGSGIAAEAILRSTNLHMNYANVHHHGFIVFDVFNDGMGAIYYGLDTVRSQDYRVKVLAKF